MIALVGTILIISAVVKESSSSAVENKSISSSEASEYQKTSGDSSYRVDTEISEKSSNLIAPNLALACKIKLSPSAFTLESTRTLTQLSAEELKQIKTLGAGRVFVDGFSLSPVTNLPQGLACIQNLTSDVKAPCRTLDNSSFKTEVVGNAYYPAQRACMISGDFALNSPDALYWGGTTDNDRKILSNVDAQYLQAEVQAAAKAKAFLANYFSPSLLSLVGVPSLQATQAYSGIDPALPSQKAKIKIFATGVATNFEGPSADFQTNTAKLPILPSSTGYDPTLISSLDTSVALEEISTLYIKSIRSPSLGLPPDEVMFPAMYAQNGDITASLMGDILPQFAAALGSGNGNLHAIPNSTGSPFSIQTHNFSIAMNRAAAGDFCYNGAPSGMYDHCYDGQNLSWGPLYKHNSTSNFGVFPGQLAAGEYRAVQGSDLAANTVLNFLYNLSMATSEMKAWRAALSVVPKITSWGGGYGVNQFARDVYVYYAQTWPDDVDAVKMTALWQGFNPFVQAAPPYIPSAMTFDQLLNSVDPALGNCDRGTPPQSSFGSTPPAVVGFNGYLDQCQYASMPAATSYVAITLGSTTRLSANAYLRFRDMAGTFSTSVPTGNLVFNAGHSENNVVADVNGGMTIFIPRIAGKNPGFRLEQARYWTEASNTQNTFGIHYRVTSATSNGFGINLTNVTASSATLSAVDPSNPANAVYSADIKINGLAPITCSAMPCTFTYTNNPNMPRGMLTISNIKRVTPSGTTTHPNYYKLISQLGQTMVAGVGPGYSNIDNVAPNKFGRQYYEYAHPTIPNMQIGEYGMVIPGYQGEIFQHYQGMSGVSGMNGMATMLMKANSLTEDLTSTSAEGEQQGGGRTQEIGGVAGAAGAGGQQSQSSAEPPCSFACETP